MARHKIDIYSDIEPQLEEILKTANPEDEVEITEEIDFQAALADVEEGIYETIEDALHDKFLATGVPYGTYFEFVEIVSPTSLVVRYTTFRLQEAPSVREGRNEVAC